MSNYGKYQQTNVEDGPETESKTPLEALIRPPLRPIDKIAEPRLPCLSHRYTVALMTFLGFFVVFSTRCNYGMAKVQMDLLLFEEESKLNWDTANSIGTLSFWSFLLSQVPGGILAYKFPANKVFGFGVVCSAILNLILPWIIDYESVFAIFYVLQAFAQGLLFPAVYGILRFWAPPLERSKLATISITGVFVGMLLGVPICGFIIKFIHWRAMFIIFGIIGIVWFAFWNWLIFEKPRAHPTISEQELMYIEQSLGDSSKLSMSNIPWTKILTSLPVYAVIIATFCQMWSYFLIAFYKNSFFKHRFDFMVTGSRLFAILPYILMIIFVPLNGFLTDYLRKRKITSTTNVRKIFTCVSFGLQGLCFFFMQRAVNAPGTLLFILFTTALSGFAVSGYIVNLLDIAPRFSSILMGITNTAGFLAGLICPIVTDWITSDETENDTWNYVFMISSCLFTIAAVLYGIFSSGELQSWAEPRKDEQKSMSEVQEGNEL